MATGYIQLMRAFFKHIYQHAAKWKAVYPALSGFVEPSLGLALAMLGGPAPRDLRSALLEVCLTAPAPLQALLPHLARLVKPVTMALKVGGRRRCMQRCSWPRGSRQQQLLVGV